MVLWQELLKDKKHINEVDEIKIDVAYNVASRPRLDQCWSINSVPGKREVLENVIKFLYTNGVGGGRGLFLPFDQVSTEHGPLHNFLWEYDDIALEDIMEKGLFAGDIRAVADLVNNGPFSGYVLHPGNIWQAKHLFDPKIPLIYKIDGHITQPDAANIPSTIGSVEEAVEFKASAIGLTIYPGWT